MVKNNEDEIKIKDGRIAALEAEGDGLRREIGQFKELFNKCAALGVRRFLIRSASSRSLSGDGDA